TPPAADTALPTKPAAGLEATDPKSARSAGLVDGASSKKGSGLDPSQFGSAGKGGPPGPEALALLKNKNVILDAGGIKDIKAGRVDPRVVAVLTKLSGEHKLTVTDISSDEADPFGMDIGAIDGEMVGPDSPLAREVASELSSLNPDYRPDAIGSPFAIAGKGYFTDAAHQTHIHVGFKEPIAADWKPPKDVAAEVEAAPAKPAAPDPPPAVVAPVAAPPVAPAPVPVAPAPVAAPAAVVAEAPPRSKNESQLFQAVTAKASAADARRVARNESLGFLKAVEPPKASPVAQAAAVDPTAAAAALAAAAPDAYPGDNAPQEQIAAWMAGQAQKRGLPPELPLMASLVESGMKNLNFGDADSVGFFQMRVGIWNQGEYAGFPDKPELQVKWFLDNAEAVKKQRVAAGKSITDPNQYGDWIADVERPAEQYRGRYQLKLGEAQGLLKSAPAAAPAPAPAGVVPGAVEAAAAVAPAGGGGSSLGAAALQIAHSQKGVREIGGANMGPQVDQYLAAAKVAPGNPWCASFITWSLQKAGHPMPGGGWAAVQTWVRNAEAGQNGLKIVSAQDARPGDIVAYDWGGQEDFGSDGHIGFLDSTVQGGKFKALEGNNADAVSSVDRQMGSANIKFIRIEGNAPAGAAQVPAPSGNGVAQVADQAPAPAATSSAPIDPTQFGGDGHGGPPGAEALALLNNKNIVFDPDGIADIKAGRIDPRVVAVLTKLSGEHKITVTCMCSDHDKFTAGGSVSNHHFGRGMDIGAIDGETVGPGSPLAREVASELSSLNPDYRPNEIGSPFAIAGPGYFTDAAHQNHIHVG
ncbi:MAG TPA: CHAP domain-containing protein, partial [Solirubrobacter sp.]